MSLLNEHRTAELQDAFGSEADELWQLIYISSCSPDISDGTLRKIEEEAVAANRAADLTGVLLHKQANFLQVLEGRKSAVSTAYFARILTATSHWGQIVVASNRIVGRSFPIWSMDFHELGDNDEAILERLSSDAGGRDALAGLSPVAESFIRTFLPYSGFNRREEAG
ncbi:MAG: BLUF domain-containing protein [Thalassobaculaceae bacterium]